MCVSYTSWGIIAPHAEGMPYSCLISPATQVIWLEKALQFNVLLQWFMLAMHLMFYRQSSKVYRLQCYQRVSYSRGGRAGATGGVYVIRICTTTRTGFFNSGIPRCTTLQLCSGSNDPLWTTLAGSLWVILLQYSNVLLQNVVLSNFLCNKHDYMLTGYGFFL